MFLRLHRDNRNRSKILGGGGLQVWVRIKNGGERVIETPSMKKNHTHMSMKNFFLTSVYVYCILRSRTGKNTHVESCVRYTCVKYTRKCNNILVRGFEKGRTF